MGSATVLALVLSHAPDPPPAAPTYDLVLSREPSGPYLIEIDSTEQGTGRITVGATEQVAEVTEKSSRRSLEEITAGPPDLRTCRTILKSEVDSDGEVEDPDCVGLTIDGTSDDERFAVNVRDDRKASTKSLARIQSFAFAPLLHAPLLDDWSVGEDATSDARNLLQQLLDLDGTPTACAASLHLKSVDEAARTAMVSGTFTLREEREDEEGRFGADWSGALELVVDLATKSLAQAQVEAKTVGSGVVELPGPDGTSQQAAIAFEGVTKATARVTGGAKAEAARRTKAKIRDRTFKCRAGNVSLTLPSSFHLAKERPETLLTLQQGEALLLIGTQCFDTAGADPSQSVLEIAVAMAARDKNARAPRDVKSALGKGKVVSTELDGQAVDVELYPLGPSRILRLRIQGPPELRKLHDKALSAMRGSLKVLKP
jgi:hypothetical protein